MKKYLKLKNELDYENENLLGSREICSSTSDKKSQKYTDALIARDNALKRIKELKELIVTNENKRVRKEELRLTKIFKDYASDSGSVVEKLISRAAFMLVQLENFEYDMKVNGSTELFSQGDQPAYDRARPVVTQYATMSGNYQKTLKQLTDLLPNTNKEFPVLDIIKDLQKPQSKP